MKCRKCDHKAVINMRQHKLALCKEHYLDWIPEQTQRFIEKKLINFTNNKVLKIERICFLWFYKINAA